MSLRLGCSIKVRLSIVVLLLSISKLTEVQTIRFLFSGLDANGKGLLYRNLFDCFYKTFKIEGMRGLYKGFVANYWRAAPHTILNLTFWEQFKKWKNLFLSDEANSYFE